MIALLEILGLFVGFGVFGLFIISMITPHLPPLEKNKQGSSFNDDNSIMEDIERRNRESDEETLNPIYDSLPNNINYHYNNYDD